MNNIIFIGHLVWIGPINEGTNPTTGKKWHNRTFVLDEIDGQHPQSILLRAWNDTVLTALDSIIALGYAHMPVFKAYLNTSANPSKNDKDKYYGDIDCWKLEAVEGGAQ